MKRFLNNNTNNNKNTQKKTKINNEGNKEQIFNSLIDKLSTFSFNEETLERCPLCPASISAKNFAHHVYKCMDVFDMYEEQMVSDEEMALSMFYDDVLSYDRGNEIEPTPGILLDTHSNKLEDNNNLYTEIEPFNLHNNADNTHNTYGNSPTANNNDNNFPKCAICHNRISKDYIIIHLKSCLEKKISFQNNMNSPDNVPNNTNIDIIPDNNNNVNITAPTPIDSNKTVSILQNQSIFNSSYDLGKYIVDKDPTTTTTAIMNSETALSLNTIIPEDDNNNTDSNLEIRPRKPKPSNVNNRSLSTNALLAAISNIGASSKVEIYRMFNRLGITESSLLRALQDIENENDSNIDNDNNE